VYWTANNFLLLLQFLLFNTPRTRAFLGIMPRIPPEKTKVARPGIMGFMADRIEYIKLAWKNYEEEARKSRMDIDKVGKDDFGNDIKYETQKKGKADK
jgi:hypothetical protein